MHSWSLAIKNKSFLLKLILSFFFLGILLIFLAYFLNFIEARHGHIYYDPILNFFKPRDVSNYIFFITYGSATIGLVYALQSPFHTVHLCQMYSLLTVFRVVSMFFIPLDPPPSIIPLKDVFLENTFYEGNENLKDLFFSGHTATLFLLFFFVSNKYLKWFFFVAATAVAIGVMIQHAHYSLDVIFAPLFAFLSYFIIRKSVKFYGKKSSEQVDSTIY